MTEKQRRGFAAMDPEKVKAIASKGGKAAHACGTAHVFTSEEAQRAGKKGGTAPHKSRGKQPALAPASDALQERLPIDEEVDR